MNALRRLSAISLASIITSCIGLNDRPPTAPIPSQMACVITPDTVVQAASNGFALVQVQAVSLPLADLDSVWIKFGDGTETGVNDRRGLTAPHSYIAGTHRPSCHGRIGTTLIRPDTATLIVLPPPAGLPSGSILTEYMIAGRSNFIQAVANPGPNQRVDSMTIDANTQTAASVRGDTIDVTLPANSPASQRGNHTVRVYMSNNTGSVMLSQVVRSFLPIVPIINCDSPTVSGTQTMSCVERFTDTDGLRSVLTTSLYLRANVYKRTAQGLDSLTSIPQAQQPVTSAADSLKFTFPGSALTPGTYTVRGTANYFTSDLRPVTGTANATVTRTP